MTERAPCNIDNESYILHKQWSCSVYLEMSPADACVSSRRPLENMRGVFVRAFKLMQATVSIIEILKRPKKRTRYLTVLF